MTLDQIRKIIDDNGGEREYLINWEWAYFADNETGERVFNMVAAHCEHRGFYRGEPENTNPNLHRPGFRFR